MDPAYRGRDHQRRQFCHSCRNHRTIVLATRHTARGTSEMGMFVRLLSLLTITVLALMCAHIAEITVWTGYYWSQALKLNNATYFEFAFENYTALGYGDALPADGNRLIGPITALNGLLLSAGRLRSSSRLCGWLNCDLDYIARLPIDETGTRRSRCFGRHRDENVRFGSKATCAAQKVMSALPPKADMCGETSDVRFVPKADIGFCPFLLRAAEPFSRGIFDMAALSRPR